jgi:pimeloyl-ACP methyl ester carboxylesterase
VRRKGWLGLAAAGVGAAAAAVTAGVVVERRVVRSRRVGSLGADQLGGLHGDETSVTTDDGVVLHVEVDEVAPYASAGRLDPDHDGDLEPHPPTLVFVHGYALSLDCWYFQREFFRGKHRLVFFDLRSLGRSGRSDKEHATIDQLGDDLAKVLADVVPEGPVVLIGHSMGGMAIMAFAERHPDVFDARVVGAGLVATTAGGLKTHHLVSRLIPDSVGGQIGPRVIAGLARAPGLVDSVRRRGSNIGFLVAQEFAFGGDVPASYVEFVDNMLAATSFEVLAQFFPNFDALDKYTVLATFGRVPTYVVAGTKDVMTSLELSRTMAERIPGATLVECPGAGHMVILEQNERVNAALEDLVEAAGSPTSASRVS